MYGYVTFLSENGYAGSRELYTTRQSSVRGVPYTESEELTTECHARMLTSDIVEPFSAVPGESTGDEMGWSVC
jgi:hypothetical protein